MADVSRRGFLTQASIATGVGLAGGLGLHKLLAAGATSEAMPDTGAQPAPASEAQPELPSLDGVTLAGPMLIHVRDVATGEVSMMVGAQELVYRDTELVSRLVRTAANAGNREG